jgi:hypothetical protein
MPGWALFRRATRMYDLKAIAAAAHNFHFDRPLRRSELYGGLIGAVANWSSSGSRC